MSNNTAPTDLTDGKLRFVQHFLPPLEAGDYKLTLQQNVSDGKGNDESYNPADIKFSVKGDRFQILPMVVTAAYPPANRQGQYDNTLPHIVLNRRTLLWERSLTGEPPPSPKKGKTDPDVPSWLALLVFYDGDPAPKLTSGTVADLVPVAKGGKLPDGFVSYPALKQIKTGLDYGEELTDPLYFIDVPKSLFEAIAPTTDELKTLAHTRTVDQTAKADAMLDGNPTKDYAVLVANRLPAKGSKSYVHLVSLEGMVNYLSGGTGLPSATVRLASLYTWNFTAAALPETFRDFLLNVDDGKGNQGNDGMIGLVAPSSPKTDAEKTVANALRWGYVPLAHQTRNGETTVSWFRGPLAPDETTVTETFPKSHADELLRYDPDHGIFDVSYAAAWELGRLLALQNKTYARALYQWKKRHKLESIQAKEQEMMKQRWGDAVTGATGDSAAFRQTAALYLMLNNLARLTETIVADVNSILGRNAPSPPEQNNAGDEDLAAIAAAVGRWRLLYGVPFDYLVPDARLLPPESIRFFRLDNQWIDSLVDGAFSLGRAGTTDAAHDAVLSPRFAKEAHRAAYQIRAQLTGEEPLAIPADPGPVTGFLLRSGAVAGWPGIQVEGYSNPNKQDSCPLLRMSHLDGQGGELLLCLFDGVVLEVYLHPPAEGLHFGLDEPKLHDTTYTKSLRYTATYDGHTIGDQIPDSGLIDGKPIAAGFRDADKRVLDIDALAQNIQKNLTHVESTNLAQFTAAEFGLEMVEGVDEIKFTVAAIQQ